MRKILCVCLFVMCCVTAWGQRDSLSREKIRQEIGIDYSVPDFSADIIDKSKMGARNASLLHSLEKNYSQSVYNRSLASIIIEQKDLPVYSQLDVTKLKVLNVTKRDRQLIIKIRAWLSPKNVAGKNTEVVFVFDNGISDSEKVNNFFRNIGRYTP